MTRSTPDNPSLLSGLIKDGRPLLAFTGLSLVLSGLFALFLGATGHFLPHDVQFLGMTPEELCRINDCRIVHFMIHDRVAFGGSLIAIGVLYMWLAEFPLRDGQAWSWWLFLVSGTLGFASFLAYLGYGYLDTWHGLATLALLPCFVVGLIRSYSCMRPRQGIHCLLQPSLTVAWGSGFGIGRACLLATSAGLIAGGLTIMTVGMTRVFVPQDLEFMGLQVDDLNTINDRLVPLIAHDRAGFGGGVCSYGIMMLFCLWCGRPSRSLWEAVGLAGTTGFATAIFVHPAIGYTDLIHLAPAVVGALAFGVGLALTSGAMFSGTLANESADDRAARTGRPRQR